MIWKITKFDEKALDRYEGWPGFYSKENFTVSLNDKPAEVMIYIMNEGPSIALPSSHYYNTIQQGYKSAKFGLEILNNFLKNSKNRMS